MPQKIVTPKRLKLENFTQSFVIWQMGAFKFQRKNQNSENQILYFCYLKISSKSNRIEKEQEIIHLATRTIAISFVK